MNNILKKYLKEGVNIMPKGEILAIAIYWQKFKKFSVIKSGQDK
jgi:hypothetical protein